jgi:hypothetical protein
MPARILFLATVAAVAASGQTVVSVRSGLINFSEGEVYLSDQPRGQAIEQKAGKFPELREGVELRTEAGRAEVLLTPGMLLRVGPDSAVRMISASLIDTRVEFRRGSAVIEVTEDPDGTKARILYKDYEFRFPKRGSFRIDSLPREFRVYEGEANISYLGEKCTLTKDHKISLYGGLEAETLRRSISDGLDEWSMRRDSQLAAANPPPGDLDGGDADPMFSISPNAFYGLGGYSAPVTPYSYWPYSGIYGAGAYGGIYSGVYGYGGYGYGYSGGYGYLPMPVHGIPGRPIYSSPVQIPLRPPVRSPIVGGGLPHGMPRGYAPPTPIRPVTPAPRPIAVGHPKSK